MQLRITFSNYDDAKNPYYGGGGARAIHEVAKRLVPRNRVRVLTANYPGATDEVIDGVTYWRLGGTGAGPKLGQVLFQWRLPWEAARGGFDVWVESLTPPFSTAWLPLFTRRRIVALTQVLAGRAMARKYKLPFGLIERLGLRSYRHAIALSGYLKQELLRANSRLDVAVIPNGVNRDLIQKPIQRTQEAHVLFLGRIDVEQKGLDLLLEAYGGIKDQIGLPLLIAGSGTPADEAFLSQRLKELNLADRVRLLGRVEDQAKEDLLSRAAFLVMPSRFEASPLVLVEAFCYQLPVVLFAIPELAELPETCCVKAPAFNTKELGQAMLALSQDPGRRQALGLASKELARNFDWDDLAAAYEDFLNYVVRGPIRRRHR